MRARLFLPLPLGLAALLLVAGAACCRRSSSSRSGEHIAVGRQSTCTLDVAGVPECWGPTIRVARPPPIGTRFVSLRAANKVACGITTERRAVCFGDCGPVNAGSICDPPPSSFDEVSVGFEDSACALAYPSTVRCWGFMAPWRSPPPEGDRFHGLTVGERYACVLDGEGTIRCWGDRDRPPPSPPKGPGFRAIAAARAQICALDAASEIVCWGSGENTPPSGQYQQISANWDQFCALDKQGTARCWGLEKGSVRRGERHGRDLREIAAGQNHSCGIRRSGEVECWGEQNEHGEGILPRDGAPLPPLRVAESDENDANASASAPDAGIRHRPFPAEPRLPTEDPPDEPLSVVIDGHAVPIKSAIASTAGEEAVNIVLSTLPLTCDAAKGGWQQPQKEPESRILLTLASLVAEPDGDGGYMPSVAGRLRVSRAAWSGGLGLRAGGIATLGPRAAERGGSDRLRITYKSATFGGDRSKLEIRGATTVRGCGSLPPKGVARPQPDVEVEIAGVRVPIRGALLVDNGHGPALRLTSGPAACAPGGVFDARWDYEITVHDAPSKQLGVWGAKVDVQHLTGDPRLLFEVVPGTGSDEVDVQVDDRGVTRSFPTRVRGTVHALRCMKPEGPSAR